MTTVLAIDQGTSGTKAVVVDGAGGLLSLVEQDIHPSYLPGGGVEQDPQELIDSVLMTARAAADRAGANIDIVTLTNQGETVLAWDPETGEALSQAVVWQDRRADGLCQERAQHAEYVAHQTGLVLDPYFSAPKMRWLRDNLTTSGVVTTTDAWIIHRLTGEFVTDASTASRSLAVDLDTGAWNERLLDIFGLQDERLPRIVACDEVVGETSLFGGSIPVGGLIVDQQAALLAENCLEPGDAKCTFGTGAFLLANTGTAPKRSSAGLAACVAWNVRSQHTYCLDGQVYTAASAVRWLRELGLVKDASQLDAVAAADSDGTLCVPALAGLAAPWWRPDARALIAGMSLSTGKGQIVRAVLEGIACQVSELADAMAKDLDSGLTRLRVDGGLTRSRVLMQAVSDLTGLPVEVYPSPHATPLGAVATARLAHDANLTPAEAVVAWEPSMTYEQRWSGDRAQTHLSRWRAAAEAAINLEGTP
jgi:glycerol kinase